MPFVKSLVELAHYSDVSTVCCHNDVRITKAQIFNIKTRIYSPTFGVVGSDKLVILIRSNNALSRGQFAVRQSMVALLSGRLGQLDCKG